MKKILVAVALLTLAATPLAAQDGPLVPEAERATLAPPTPFDTEKTPWKPGWHVISYFLETFDEGPFPTYQACNAAAAKNNKENPAHNYVCVWENEPRASISGPPRH